ncbi:MAG: hypothetical protein UW73_C0009G0067 [Microgenomates group bacterium GW2011_GWB1_44_8]|nr:MAG: hypothetical protein UW73_C0009G0067 [Microgenomates group bacterium GW2011_GWB1_44_8]
MLTTLIAQLPHPLNQTINGIGPLGDPNLTKCNSVTLLASTLSSIIGFITVLAFVWFTFQIIVAAIQWVASGGEKAAVQSAQQRITHSIIGLVISVAGVFIVILISNILGIGNILNLLDIFPKLVPGPDPCV